MELGEKRREGEGNDRKEREKKKIKSVCKGRDFPGGTVVKDPPASAGDTRSSPGPGRPHMPRSN